MDAFLEIFIRNAWAQDGGSTGQLASFLPLIVIFVLFYFLLIRPQSKRQKEHKQMVEGLGIGDEIVTGGGVLGKITEVGEQFVTVEIADKVAVKIQRHTIASLLPKGTVKSS
jgi:preprotein translocase subunit YajC